MRGFEAHGETVILTSEALSTARRRDRTEATKWVEKSFLENSPVNRIETKLKVGVQNCYFSKFMSKLKFSVKFMIFFVINPRKYYLKTVSSYLKSTT